MPTNKSLAEYDEEPLPEVHKMRTNHLLVIAIDEYENGIQDLNNAVRDAEAVRDSAVSAAFFASENTVTLLNKEATRHNIISAFETFIEKLGPNDNFVFYFSGHGDMYKPTKRGYWIPTNGKPSSRSSWLSNNDIKDFMEYMQAHHVFGIVDSCFSGALFRKNASENDTQININTLTYLDSYPSRWLLTAGRETIVEDGVPGTHSPFAKTLISQLQYNPNQALAVSKLCGDVIMSPAIDKVNAKPRGAALPLSSSQGGEFIFYRKGFVPERSKALKDTSPSRNVATPPKQESIPQQASPTTSIAKDITLKDQLKKLVRIGDTDKSFELLDQKVDPESRLANDLMVLQSRHYRLERDKKGGLISDEYYAMSANKITHSLLSYVNDMDDEDIL